MVNRHKLTKQCCSDGIDLRSPHAHFTTKDMKCSTEELEKTDTGFKCRIEFGKYERVVIYPNGYPGENYVIGAESIDRCLGCPGCAETHGTILIDTGDN